MNLQQLIELAVLDAMGLLDESEQGQFESAFRSASPPVQAQVRREQTRLSVIEALLPDVEPPAGLRAAVVDAVRRQIEIEGLVRAEGVAGAIPLIPSRRVSPLWRAGALGLAAASFVMGFATLQMSRDVREIERRLGDQGQTQVLIEKFGANYVRDVLFNKDTTRVVFTPRSSQSKSMVSVFLNPEWRDSKLFHMNLGDAERRTYKLALVDEHDRVVSILHTFNPDGSMEGENFELGHPAPKSRLAIMTTSQSGADEIVGTGDLPTPSL